MSPSRPIQWEAFEYSAGDALVLAGRKYGWANRDPVPVVCLAGLTRNSADFHELALHLSRDSATPRRVLCLDCRGRGESAHDRDWRNYNVLRETDDVMAGMVAAGIETAVFVGTSRGGMIVMALTALRPGIIRAAVLNDVGPKIEAQGLVRIKNYLDTAEEYRSVEDAAAKLKAQGGQSFPGWDLQRWYDHAERAYAMRNGRLVPRYDRNLIRTLAEINLDNPLPTMWPQFEALCDVPVMVIRGENSDVLSAQTVDRMRERHPALHAFEAPGQGHAPDLGEPDIAARIDLFLFEQEDAGTAAA